ncbi:MAG: dTDP-4-amino-4,6-dideoxygalactose transaminase [Proteobacteria bacterium]|nr:dTDP-4-amino-4,6-dideoxygalactose transaminase [Pseudomonadota bacterium]
MTRAAIPFNRPYMTGRELACIGEAHASGHLAGDGMFTQRCHAWLERRLGSARALLTHSCTAALEMAALLLDIGPGDEVIMPSFTFVSTANAFVLRGAVPLFVDIRSDTLNIDENLVEAAISPRTRAIVVVHYAGIPCAMDALIAIARRHGVAVIEDAAQGLLARHADASLGAIGDLGALSFHETKNVISGEGGALLVNDPQLVERAEIIREKGTNRTQFHRGMVDKYTWVGLGSSYLPSELVAAFLWAQLEEADAITARRIAIWQRYHHELAPLEQDGIVRRPLTPPGVTTNGHLYYLLLPSADARAALITALAAEGIQAVFHYVPLHSSPFGRQHARAHGSFAVTDRVAATILRLPLWLGIEPHQPRVIDAVLRHVRAIGGRFATSS